MKDHKEQALHYHAEKPAGKLRIIPSKPCKTAEDLSLAYTPGVAEPCLEIQKDAQKAYAYTTKGNLVAVISNGTAVLGLGDIGALAGKPVMEGKSVLFKRFGGVEAMDIEVAETDVQKFVDIVAAISPTFGGINLEDIKAPECFVVEEALKKRLDIPVFHDDQHGTAVIVAAALFNALHLAGKNLSQVKIVFSGAGAAALACARFLVEVGARKEHISLFDSKGLVTKNRAENPYKAFFAQEKEQSMAEALRGADVFIGVSKGNLLTKDLIRSMGSKPIVFAMANPVPEISYEEGKASVADIIMATGRSDFPNQVNNVLGFPFIFRGALDVRAREITSGMKLAAAKALAALARKKVPAAMAKAYGRQFAFGPEYIIPKPFDPRLLPLVSAAVAKAAMDDGVARVPITDFVMYKKSLQVLARKLAKGKFC